MTINGKYVVWSCCGIEIEDNKEDAFGHAYYLDYDSDTHTLVEIEGPDGIIDHEAETSEYAEYARKREAVYKRMREASPKAVGKIEVQSLDGDWSLAERVTAPNIEEEKAYYIEALGAERVRFVADK